MMTVGDRWRLKDSYTCDKSKATMVEIQLQRWPREKSVEELSLEDDISNTNTSGSYS